MGTAGKKSDPKALALILAVIVLIAGAVFIRLWANQQRLDVPNFRAMTVAPDGRVFLVIGNDLFIEDGAGNSLRVIPLSRWGVRNHYGDIAVLADGSVILAQGRLGAVSVAEGARIYARERPAADDPIEGLQRCIVETGECTALAAGDNGIGVRRAFSIEVDEREGRMYVSDPANHRLIMANLDGEQLAVSDQDWIFPNGIIRASAASVGFADTNNHRYVELAIDAGGFGDIRTEESIYGWPGVDRSHRFPFEVLIDDAGAMWMLVAANNMSDAWLYRRDPDGGVRRIALPDSADPVALAMSGDRVLVADAQHFQVHALDPSGNVLRPFGSGVLRLQLANHQRTHAGYEAIFDYSLLAVLLVALPALVMGMVLQLRAQRVETTEVVDALPDGGETLFTESPQAQLAQLRGEFIFWRKYGALGTREGARFGVLVAALFLVLLGTILLFDMALAEHDGRALSDVLGESPRNFVFVAIGVGGLMFHWLSGMYERLYVTREGIRYTSFLSGPLRLFNALHSDWFISWQDVREIRLIHRAGGRRPLHWFYEVIDTSGRRRRLRPFFWRLAGEHETGIPLRVTGITQETYRSAIRKTVLYRLLARQRATTGAPASAPAVRVMEGQA